MNSLILALISYFIGSFPTAYLFDRNIFKKGTGNMGAFNFMAENKKIIQSILILVIDVLKGIIIASLSLLFAPNYASIMISVVSGIIGHCYSPWVGFKGGRGLALACGAALILEPVFLIIILIILGILYLIIRDYIKAGLVSIPFIIALIFLMNLSSDFLILSIICAILIAHKDFIKNYAAPILKSIFK